MSLSVEHISKYYGKQLALDSISFSAGQGSIVGILGPNGAGKSTLLKIIAGTLEPSSGKVTIGTEEELPESLAYKRKIGYLPENNPLYTDLFVKEYLLHLSQLYRIPTAAKRVNEMIELTGLGDECHKKIGALSRGYRQRVGLAQALLHDPDLLILDEATSGLDPAQLVEIRQLIRNVSQNKTVLFSTHIMQEVEAICDRVLILNHGKMIALDTPETIKKTSLKQIRRYTIEFLEHVEASLFSKINGITKLERSGSNSFDIFGSAEDLRPELFRFALQHKLTMITLFEHGTSMEKSFLELIDAGRQDSHHS